MKSKGAFVLSLLSIYQYTRRHIPEQTTAPETVRCKSGAECVEPYFQVLLHISMTQFLRVRWAGHVVRMGEDRGVYRVLVGKTEGRRPLGRPRRRWVDNIRTDLQEVGCGYVDWIGLAQDRDRRRTLVSAVMNLRVP